MAGPLPGPGRVKKGSLVHRRQFLRQTSAGLAVALSPGAAFQARAVVDRRVAIGGLMTPPP